jgi:type III pantothenate kinase
MLLAIDVGNTNTAIGLFEGDELRFRWRVSTDARRTADEFAILVRELCAQSGVELAEVSRLCLCSVVPMLTTALVSMSRKVLGVKPIVVGIDLDLGIEIEYRDPSEVGADRLADAVAAHELHDGPVIVVDFGTATTFDVVSGDGRYLGGAIAPGPRTSVENLFSKAALLHRVALEPPTAAVGRSTEESLRSGITYGIVGQVDGIVRRIVEEWGEDPTVVATGGFAPRVAPFSEEIDIVDPDLTLKGLRIIEGRVAGRATKEGA